MMKQLGVLALLGLLILPANAADNAIQVTIGAGPTLRSVDVGSGVQAPAHVIVNSAGTNIVGAGTTLPVSGTITGITNPITITGTLTGITNPVAVTGTFWQTTQPISVASLPLPTGAATQTTLASVLTALGSPFQAGGSIGNTTFAATQSGTWNIGSISGTIVLPLGASTSANQSTEIGSLASIVTNTTPYVRAARNFPGCTVGTSTGLCLAANTAVTFLQVQNTSVAANVACAFGVSAVLNSSTSIQLAPGQPANWGPSTGGVPSGAMNCISSVASTPLYVEWN